MLQNKTLDITTECITPKGLIANGFAFVKIKHYRLVKLTIHKSGYIVFLKKGRKYYDVICHYHRYLYEQRFGRLPKDYDAHHECRNKLCINLKHIQPLTKSEHHKLHWQDNDMRLNIYNKRHA